MLSKITPAKRLDNILQKQYHQLLATAYARNKDFLHSAKERILLANYIDTPIETQQNLQVIWNELQHSNLPSLRTLALEANSESLQGWFSLAYKIKLSTFNPLFF